MSGLVDALLDAPDLGTSNRARLALQRDATPPEIASAWERRHRLSADARAWLARLHQYTLWDHPTPEPFVRVRHEPAWCAYRGPAGPDGRELVVAFGGGGGNLLLPAPVVLQRLDARARDFIIVRDPSRRSFTGEAGGVTDLAALVDRIAAAAAPYRSVVTIGASMGGAPALHVGVAIGARRAISLSGRMPAEDRAALLRALLAADGREAPAGGAATEIVCAFGAENARDGEGARSLQEAFPTAVLLPVAHVDQHNVLHVAFQQGALRPLWSTLLDGDPRRPDGAEPADGHRAPGAATVWRFTPVTTPPDWALPTLSAAATRLRRLPVVGRLLSTRAGRRVADVAGWRPPVAVERLLGQLVRRLPPGLK